MLKISKVNYFDIANGNGIRVSIFVSGCKFHCKGCFNSKIWSFDVGKNYSEEIEKEILNTLDDYRYEGLSILGGDPLCQDDEGLNTLITLCKKVKELNKNIWLWTGYKKEEIDSFDKNDLRKQLLDICDVYIDGRFEEDKRDFTLAWRGSSNQTINKK